jgi:DNA recombination-dependent growth factor C
MISNAIIYRIAPLWPADLPAIEQALAKAPFIECGATQERSIGFVPPRGEECGALVEAIGGQWIARFKTETKAIPAEVLARKVAEKAELIEQETGRKPGKKECRELKDEAKLDLLPMAFPKQASTWVWIDPAARTLVIDASSQSRADMIVSALVDLLPGLSVSLLNTQSSPQACMAHWLRLCTFVNVGLAIEDQGIVRGLKEPLMEAHFALQSMSARMEKTGIWVPGALRAIELEAIRALVDWHLAQLSKLSNSEYDAAYDLARGHVTSAGGEVVDIKTLEEA